MMIPDEAYSLAGLAALSFVGERALKASGQSDLAEFLSIVVTVAGTVIVVKMFWDGLRDAMQVVGVFL